MFCRFLCCSNVVVVGVDDDDKNFVMSPGAMACRSQESRSHLPRRPLLRFDEPSRYVYLFVPVLLLLLLLLLSVLGFVTNGSVLFFFFFPFFIVGEPFYVYQGSTRLLGQALQRESLNQAEEVIVPKYVFDYHNHAIVWT